MIINNDGFIETNWYTKKTYSGRVLNFLSNHPKHQKRAMVMNLVDKAIFLAHKKYHKDNIQFIKNILYNNKYPPTFFNKIINKRLNYLKYNYNNDNENTRNTIDFDENIILPYYSTLSERLEQNLKKHDKKVIYKINNMLNHIIKKGKDKLNSNRNQNIVYKINCINCNACYIGETKRVLEKRINEHKNDINKDPFDHGVISKHRTTTSHRINWDKVQILDHEAYYDRRCISEMLYIRTSNNILNAQIDTEKAPDIYDKIIC